MTGVRWASAQVTGPSLQAHLEQHMELLLSMLDLRLGWSSTCVCQRLRLLRGLVR